MKSYTDIEQAKKLAEFLPLESADWWYSYYGNPTYNLTIAYKGEQWFLSQFRYSLRSDIPCWSLAALFSMLPKSAYLEKGSSTELCRLTLPVELISSDWNLEPIDACYEIILKLKENEKL